SSQREVQALHLEEARLLLRDRAVERVNHKILSIDRVSRQMERHQLGSVWRTHRLQRTKHGSLTEHSIQDCPARSTDSVPRRVSYQRVLAMSGEKRICLLVFGSLVKG